LSNVETVQAIYDAFGRGDVPAILDMLADDVQWDQEAPSHGIPIYEPGTGKEHVRRFFEMLEELEFLRFEPTNFLTGENQVAVTINLGIKVKATGKTAEALEIHLWTFGEDGKVTRFFHCIDRHALWLAYGSPAYAGGLPAG
jgi:ketosteroid isomerase-like protein